MGIDSICFRVRVGIFYHCARSMRIALNFSDVMCFAILYFYGIEFLPVILLITILPILRTTVTRNADFQKTPICNKNVRYTTFTVSIVCYFLCALYLLSILINLANDVEVNPGPGLSDPSPHNMTDSISLSATNSDPLLETNFSFVHMNIQSLISKLDIIEVELRDYSILSFTETWLKESDITSDVYLPGFQTPFCYCRNDHVGGGVSVYVKISIYANVKLIRYQF